jgi:hypothetical protein
MYRRKNDQKEGQTMSRNMRLLNNTPLFYLMWTQVQVFAQEILRDEREVRIRDVYVVTNKTDSS